MIGLSSGADWSLFGAIAGVLFLFGVLYNSWVGRLGEDKEGYTSLFVALGVFIALAAGAVFFPIPAAFFLALFVASGLPMIVGDIQRYQRRRKEAKERILAEVRERDADTP